MEEVTKKQEHNLWMTPHVRWKVAKKVELMCGGKSGMEFTQLQLCYNFCSYWCCRLCAATVKNSWKPWVCSAPARPSPGQIFNRLTVAKPPIESPTRGNCYHPKPPPPSSSFFPFDGQNCLGLSSKIFLPPSSIPNGLFVHNHIFKHLGYKVGQIFE